MSGTGKPMTVLNVRPNHPGRGIPSRIELNIDRTDLKIDRIDTIVLTPNQALRLAEDLLMSVRIVSKP